MSRWTGNDCRVMEMTESEVRSSADGADPILGSIVDEGLSVAGHSSWLRSLLQKAAAR